MSEIVLTDEIFESEVLQSELPVLVDFWAEWCVPCRMLSPLVEQMAGEYEGKLKVAKLNVDECPETSSRYMIQSIPTLMVFHKGEIAAHRVGVVPRQTILEMFEKLI
jgi:thioredoxin 1